AGGGNSGASFTHDYVELFNAGPAAVSIDGWTVQYASAASASWQTTALSGSIQPGRYYLVQLASAAAVVTTTTALACGASAGSCAGTGGIEDLVGYGSAADFEGGSPAAALSSTTAAVRANAGCTDTDSNADDFTADAPTPRNSASPATSCSGGGSGGGGGSTSAAAVDVDIQGALSLSLERPTISFGAAASGAT